MVLECALVDEVAIVGFDYMVLQTREADWLEMIVETHELLVQILDLLVVVEVRYAHVEQ